MKRPQRLSPGIRRPLGPLALCAGALVLAGASSYAAPADPVRPADEYSKRCDYGITLAMSGRSAVAETAFVSLLSDQPGDVRALNNLGNLHFMRGEPDVAIAFYDWAVKADSTDAGIRLNRATCYLALGDQDRASREAETGVHLAGGLEAANRLVGLRPEDDAPAKAAEHSIVSAGELRALLKAAAAAVPADSSRRAGMAGEKGGKGRPKATWRSGGTRAADDFSVNKLLYWKH